MPLGPGAWLESTVGAGSVALKRSSPLVRSIAAGAPMTVSMSPGLVIQTRDESRCLGCASWLPPGETFHVGAEEDYVDQQKNLDGPGEVDRLYLISDQACEFLRIVGSQRNA